jgi:hypothetical protein
MSDSRSNKILATVSAQDFIGRTGETEVLLRHAKGELKSAALLLLSAPALGSSELLKQIYDQLFHEHGKTIPFYFSVKESDKTVKNVAARFLQTFITQVVAFRLREPKLYQASPDIGELAELALPEDNFWIDPLIALCRNESASKNDYAFVRN